MVAGSRHEWGTDLKILCIDIETTPNLAHVWGLWDQNVGLNQLIEATEMMCFAAKWVGEKNTFFYSTHKNGKEVMVQKAHELLTEADVVMHYNGKRFDVPHLNREFLKVGLLPAAPFKQIDLMNVVKKQFKFPSYKLDYVSKYLGLAGKTKHSGHDLWKACMAGDGAAWARMKRYNKQDVRLLEDMYAFLRPWITQHPNFSLHDETNPDADSCPTCGSVELKPQGFAYTSIGKYQRYQCAECGKWSRSSKRAGFVSIREVVA